jgi:hypothetical protein
VDTGDFVARVDDDSFACFLIGEDGAVALEWADGEALEDHVAILGWSGELLKKATRAGAKACPAARSKECYFFPGVV